MYVRRARLGSILCPSWFPGCSPLPAPVSPGSPSAGGCIPGVAGDVSSATAEVRAKTNLARSLYQEHYNWFRANSSKLDASSRSHFASILQAEIALLQPIEGALFALESYGRSCGLSGYRARGLGLVPAVYAGKIALTAAAIGVLVAIGIAAAHYFSNFEEKANEAERLRQSAQINDMVVRGQITPDQGAAMLRNMPQANSGIPWGLIALLGVGGVGTFIALKG